MSDPTARPFAPRHRPPPIQLEPARVSFAPSPVARASLLSNIRQSREEHPRTPYPPVVADEEGVDEGVDPRVYAALHAKQQELMATSRYIAAQQQRLQYAMMSAQYAYYDDDGAWTAPQQAYAYQPSPPVPARSPSPFVMYSLENGSSPSVGKKRKGHKKSASLSSSSSLSLSLPAGEPPVSVSQFEDYRVAVGPASPDAETGSNQFAPARQPVVPITLEELGKPANAGLNFWAVDVARCKTPAGRVGRGRPVVGGSWERTWQDADLLGVWNADSEFEAAVRGLSV